LINPLIDWLVKLLFLGCNFITRNARWQIKGSKDTYYNLVSNKAWVKNWLFGAQGLVTWAKKAKTYPTYDVTHKNKQSKTLQFVIIDLQHLLSTWTDL